MKSKKDDRATLLQIEERRLIEELPLRGEIFLPTQAVPVAERVAGLKRVRAIYEWWWKREYAPRLRDLRRQYAGKGRCFIIGNGPSLNRTDLTKLRDEVTFGVNGLFLKFEEMGFTPTFYVVEDHLVAEDRAQRSMRSKARSSCSRSISPIASMRGRIPSSSTTGRAPARRASSSRPTRAGSLTPAAR